MAAATDDTSLKAARTRGEACASDNWYEGFALTSALMAFLASSFRSSATKQNTRYSFTSTESTNGVVAAMLSRTPSASS